MIAIDTSLIGTFSKNVNQYTDRPVFEHARWCLYQLQQRGTKITKPPVSVNGRYAKVNDASTFTDYDTALYTYRNHNQGRYNGLDLLIADGLSGLDIDHCINEQGEISPMAQKIIEGFRTYTELSCSGTGVHLLFRTAPDIQYDKGLYETHNAKDGLEIYLAGIDSRFLTYSGYRINDNPVREVPQSLIDSFAKRFMPWDKQ